jgi:inhibitor of cysteine peptidase
MPLPLGAGTCRNWVRSFSLKQKETNKGEKLMKGKIFLSIIVLGVALIAGATLLKYSSFTHSATEGTSITNPSNNQVPPAPNKYLVSLSAQDFGKETQISKQVEVKTGDVFSVALDSNATTGFSWTEQAKISDGKILTQTAHRYIAPSSNNDTPVVGMTGIEEWTFSAKQAGTTTATVSYGRPWDTGEKDARIFVLTVIVK